MDAAFREQTPRSRGWTRSSACKRHDLAEERDLPPANATNLAEERDLPPANATISRKNAIFRLQTPRSRGRTRSSACKRHDLAEERDLPPANATISRKNAIF